MIIELNLNKTNTKLVSTNSVSCYIIGIGVTDYTIHKEANGIRDIYKDKYNFFSNYTILDKHDYHVFRHSVRTIISDIKWRKVITYKGVKYNVLDSYVGIKDKCKGKLEEGYSRYKSLEFEGQDIREVPEKIKYVLELEIKK